MHIKAKVFLALTLGLLIGAAEVSTMLAQSKKISDSNTRAVQKALENFIEAFNNLEWERFRQCFSDDVTVFNPAIPEVADLGRADGKAKVEAIFKIVFDVARKQKSDPPYMNIQPKDLKIQMLKDAAIVTFRFERGESSFGRRTIVFQKQKGKWLIVHIHASNVFMEK